MNTTRFIRARCPGARSTPRQAQRGTVLLVVLLMSAVIAVSLASYLRLATTTLRGAQRSFHAAAATDLTECGVEEAMACFYQYSRGVKLSDAWKDWKQKGDDVIRTFQGFQIGPNTTGEVTVLVRNYSLSSPSWPVIVCRALVSPPDGERVESWLEVTCKPRGLFTSGVIATEKVYFTNGGYIDSWNSDPDGDPATPPVPYSKSVATANALVACSSKVNNAVEFGGAQIYGRVASGGGTISYSSTAVVSGTIGGTGVDPTRLSYDFAATLPPVRVPTPIVVNHVLQTIGKATTLPRLGDLMAPDGRYYYNFAAGVHIELQASDKIDVKEPAVFIFANHAGASTIYLGAKASIAVDSKASLAVYTNGDILTQGKGFINNGKDASKLMLFGTHTTPGGQKVEIAGLSGAGGALYLPNGRLIITGSGELSGAFIGYRVDLNGGAEVHADEALSNLLGATGVAVSGWKPLLTAEQRAVYSDDLKL